MLVQTFNNVLEICSMSYVAIEDMRAILFERKMINYSSVAALSKKS